VEIFEDVGRALCIGILDIIEDNPISRIQLSTYKTLQNIRNDVEQNLQKYEVGNTNAVGVNRFKNNNTKVAQAYANLNNKKIVKPIGFI
jgi:hypothetical protein